MKANIAGIDLELAYTIRAKKALADEFDGLDNIATIFENEDEETIFEDVCLIASILTQAAAERDRLKAKAFGTEPTVKAYTAEEIESLTSATDMVNLAALCVASMMEGNSGTIELKKKTEKPANAKGRKSRR